MTGPYVDLKITLLVPGRPFPSEDIIFFFLIRENFCYYFFKFCILFSLPCISRTLFQMDISTSESIPHVFTFSFYHSSHDFVLPSKKFPRPHLPVPQSTPYLCPFCYQPIYFLISIITSFILKSLIVSVLKPAVPVQWLKYSSLSKGL